MPNRLSCFVMMPYSRRSEEVYSRAILPAILHAQAADILALRADKMDSNVTLQARIESAVQSADFCVADVSGANPNVMYELGFAIASQKPVVILSEAGSARLPANLVGIPVVEYERGNLESLRAVLSRAINVLVTSLTTRAPGMGGTILTELRSAGQFFDRFALSVRHSLSALVGSPRLLVQDVFPRIQLDSKPDLFIRVVCADPEGEYARMRSRDSEVPVSNYRARLWHQLNGLRTELQSHSRQRFELRLTDRVLPASIMLSDEIALVFPYFAAGRDREAMVLDITREHDPRTFALFQQQFGSVWANAIELSLDRATTGGEGGSKERDGEATKDHS